MSDVMLVCSPCHQLIHGLRNTVTVKIGSLADLGDTGIGLGAIWLDYLTAIKPLNPFQRFGMGN